MTAAGVPDPRREPAGPGPPRPGPPGLRLAWLYLVSRRVPAALALLAGWARCSGRRCTGAGTWPAARPRSR